jgi:hypothetical protein
MNMKIRKIYDAIESSDSELLDVIENQKDYTSPPILFCYAEVKRRGLVLQENLINSLKEFSIKYNIDSLDDEITKIATSYGVNSYDEFYISYIERQNDAVLSKVNIEKENSIDELSLTTEVEKLKKFKSWFIEVYQNNDELKYYDKENFISQLHQSILNNSISINNKLCVYAKTDKGTWGKKDFTIETFAKQHFKLGILYKPIWEHAMTGLKWGALTGIMIKLLDTLIGLASVDPLLAFLFLVAIAVCFIPRIGTIGVIAISFLMMKYSSANFFLIGLVAAFTGAILGCLPGMAVGSIIGFVRKSHLPLASDAKPEPKHYILTKVLIPLIVGVGLILFYLFVFNPWLLEVIQQQ